MKCPICVEKGIRSKVFAGMVKSTLKSCPSYYDEDGEYHNHDSNSRTYGYECSNDHKWKEIIHGHSCNCGWNDPPKVEIKVING